MTVEQLISNDLPSLAPEDSGQQALALMEEFKVSHLCLVEGEEYKALVSEEELLEWSQPEQLFSEVNNLSFKPVVYAYLHPYEAIRRAVQTGISIVPVISAEQKYLGAIIQNELLDYMALHSGLEHPGGIITLLVKPGDYSLSEIARICENDDISIINLQMHMQPDSDLISVTIKTNSKELQSLVASFERYEYTVSEVFGEMPNSERMSERYRLLMNYINM